MAIIEDIDAELAHGSSTLLPRGEPPEEQPQPPEEVQEAPPPPPPLLKHGQYGERILLGCSLFGCNHVVECKEQRYCCTDHMKIAQLLASQDQPYTVVDGFFTKKDSREICLQMVLSLLKKVEHNVAVGIPESKDETIFQSHPKALTFIDTAFLDGESDRVWVFFHSKSNPKLKTFYLQGQGIRWSRSRRFLHRYCDFDGINSTDCYLRLSYEKKRSVRVAEGDPLELKGWALTEYVYKGQALCCLSFSSEANSSIFSTVQVTNRKRVTSDPGETSRKKKKKKKHSEDDPVMLVLLNKKRELQSIYVKTHLHVTEDIAKLIDPCVSECDSTLLASNLDVQLEVAKAEASDREPIILAVDDFLHAKREEEWLSEYNKRGNLFSLLCGNEHTIQRAATAKSLVTKIPDMILSLTATVESWETERKIPFLYDKHLLLDLLNEEKQKL